MVFAPPAGKELWSHLSLKESLAFMNGEQGWGDGNHWLYGEGVATIAKQHPMVCYHLVNKCSIVSGGPTGVFFLKVS
jgi:hypothetical protein